ncbi:MAG: DUF1549 and DUF1553 domain-containing protein [Gemmataceae bacterium]
MRTALIIGLILCASSVLADEPPRLFQPPRRPALPAVQQTTWLRNPIDAFILARLEAKQLEPNRPLDRLRLLRRVTFDLTGLPPTSAEQQAFLADRSPDAYDRVVERLLASPRFGERWGQHWLDLVRYAETDGFNQDAYRPHAHRYRDWVIQALNANLPYDRFLHLQLAGDELAPHDPDALVATGFNRLWPDEYNAANLEQRRQEILDDTTDTAGLVFLGLTMGCARCHDHKFDPLSQKDYFRLQAFFAPMQPRDLPAADPATLARHRREQAAWEERTREVRAEMEAIIGKKRQELRDTTLLRFNPDIQQAVRTAPAKRSAFQWQIALMAEKQMDRGADAAMTKLDPAAKKRYTELEKKLAALGPAPAPLPVAMAIGDVGPVAPPTHRLMGGDWRKPMAEVEPGFPVVLSNGPVTVAPPPGVTSTGRRLTLARWLTRPDHPLTARVMVNRLWQYHFGQGIVASANDFGAQGTPPTHPELLDWLACELVDSGWDLKRMHRLMVTSATYQQDSVIDPTRATHARGLAIDRANDLLWHARRRRLEGEALRDALLAVTGALHGKMFGPGCRPELPAAYGKTAWKPDDDLREQQRRSIYVFAKRNLRFPLFDVFDYPDMHNSCARRLTTTTAPQALLLLNSKLFLGQARAWSQALRSAHGEDLPAIAAAAYRQAWGREAGRNEIDLATRFLQRLGALYRDEGADAGRAHSQALADFCHAVLNTNEFLYVD